MTNEQYSRKMSEIYHLGVQDGIRAEQERQQVIVSVRANLASYRKPPYQEAK